MTLEDGVSHERLDGHAENDLIHEDIMRTSGGE